MHCLHTRRWEAPGFENQLLVFWQLDYGGNLRISEAAALLPLLLAVISAVYAFNYSSLNWRS